MWRTGWTYGLISLQNKTHESPQRGEFDEILLHLVSICEDLKFATIVMILKGDTVSESANCSALVFPVKANSRLLLFGQEGEVGFKICSRTTSRR